MSPILLEKLIVAQLVKKFLAFFGTRRFITVFSRSRQWRQMNPVHNLTPYSYKMHLNILIPSTLRTPKLSLPFKFFDSERMNE